MIKQKNAYFTVNDLAKYNGEISNAPYNNQIYVSVSGIVFNVSSNKELYGKGGTLHMFAGKEMSKNLFQSPLDIFSHKKKPVDPEKPIPKLTSKEIALLENIFCEVFKDKYPIVGKIVGVVLKNRLFWIFRFNCSAHISKSNIRRLTKSGESAENKMLKNI